MLVSEQTLFYWIFHLSILFFVVFSYFSLCHFVFLVLKVCVSAELAPLPFLQEPAVPLPLSISCSKRGLPTLWGPEDSNWFLLFVFFSSFCLCFSPFYSFRFIPAQILLPQQGCPPSHGRSTRSSSSGDCSWTDCTSSGRLPSYSERFTLKISTLTINESLHMSRLLNCLYIVKPLALQFSLKVRSSQYIETFEEYQYWSQKMVV